MTESNGDDLSHRMCDRFNAIYDIANALSAGNWDLIVLARRLPKGERGERGNHDPLHDSEGCFDQ